MIYTNSPASNGKKNKSDKFYATNKMASGLRKMRPPKRMDSVSDRILQSLFNRKEALSEAEIEFLEAAEHGDLATIQRAIHEWNVNINCLDHLGRSGLELSLMGDHQTIVEYLLPRSNLSCIGDALLYAIEKENVKVCELILDHPLYKNQRIQLSDSDGFYQKDTESPRLRPNTTPIVLAAQKNNFYIVQLLIMRGSRITPPHDYFCDCIECSNMRVFDSVKYSKSRLNTYKALASPAYISLSSTDPILTGFELSNELAGLSEIEKEYKNEYNILCDASKNYAVELLDLCRSTEEILALLNEDCRENITEYSSVDAGLNSLSRVKLALKYEQKRFIAHPTCQRQLISLWYSGVPWMRHQHVIIKLLAVPLATLLLPFMSLTFLVAPNSSFGKKMRSPFVKFLNHTCAYIVFLVLMFMASLRGGSGNPWLDMACYGFEATLPDSAVFVLILIWVLGMLMHECSQIFHDGPKGYITDWWNWMDSSLIFLYLCFYSLQITVYVKVKGMHQNDTDIICPDISYQYNCREMACEVEQASRNWTSCYPGGNCEDINYLYTPQTPSGELREKADLITDANQISDIFFALGNVLSFARIAHLLPANEQLGPLLVSFGRMLHDVVRFGLVFILVLLAFMCGLTSLYRTHQCENKHFSRMDLTLASLFWATFGMGDTSATKIDYRYLGVDKGLLNTHSKHHPITVIMGYLLFWSYILGSVVVLLNMLIAMMSNSFQEIYDDRDVEWKFARARLWIDFFEDGRTLPTPFNLIPSPKLFYQLYKLIKQKVTRTIDDPPVQLAYIYNRRKNGMTDENPTNVEFPEKPETVYKLTTKKLVQRYIYKYQTEKTELRENESEMENMQEEMVLLTTDVKKMRHEMSHIKDSVMQQFANLKDRKPNGHVNNGFVSQDINNQQQPSPQQPQQQQQQQPKRARIELHV